MIYWRVFYWHFSQALAKFLLSIRIRMSMIGDEANQGAMPDLAFDLL